MTSTKPKVVLTRTEHDKHGLEERYPHITWIEFPLIKFEYQKIEHELISEIQALEGYIVFTSQNAVSSFFQQVSTIGANKIACVGPKTAQLVESFNQKVNFIPSKSTSLALAEELPINPSMPIIYVGGNLSSEETLACLKKKTDNFIQIESYLTKSFMHTKAAWEELLQENIDVISFCSPSAVASFHEQLAKFDLKYSSDIGFAAIGLTTKNSILNLLGAKAVYPPKFTFINMIEEIVNIL